MCKIMTENEKESVKASIVKEADQNLGKTLHQLEDLCGKVNQILTVPQNHPTVDGPASKDQQQRGEAQISVQATEIKGQDVEMAEAEVGAKEGK